MRSSHMNVGQEVQAVTIRTQVQPNLCMQPTAICFWRSALRAPIPLSPFAPPSRPLHAASDTVVGHQISALGVLSCAVCPTPADGRGRAAFGFLVLAPFATVGWTRVGTWELNRRHVGEAGAEWALCASLSDSAVGFCAEE